MADLFAKPSSGQSTTKTLIGGNTNTNTNSRGGVDLFKSKTVTSTTATVPSGGFLSQLKAHPLQTIGDIGKSLAIGITAPVVKVAVKSYASIKQGVTGENVKYNVPLYGEIGAGVNTKAFQLGDKKALQQEGVANLGLAAEIGLTYFGGGIAGAGTKEVGKEVLAAGTKKLFTRKLAKQIGYDYMLGAGIGSAVAAQQKDATTKSVLTSGAVGGVFGVAAPVAIGGLAKVAIRGTSALSRGTGDLLRGAAQKLEAYGRGAIPEEDVLQFGSDFARKETGTFLQEAALKTSRVANAIADFPETMRKGLVTKFSSIDQEAARAKAAGATSVNALSSKTLRDTEAAAQGYIGQKVHDYAALRRQYLDVWDGVAIMGRHLDALDRLANGQKVYIDRKLSDGTIGKVEATVDDIQAAKIAYEQRLTPDQAFRIQEAHQQLQGMWRREIDEAYKAGAISKESYDRITEAHPNYIFNAVADYWGRDAMSGIPQGGGSSFNSYSKWIHEATGTKRDFTNLDRAFTSYVDFMTTKNHNVQVVRQIVDTLKRVDTEIGGQRIITLRDAELVKQRDAHYQFLKRSRETVKDLQKNISSLDTGAQEEVGRLSKIEAGLKNEEDKLFQSMKTAATDFSDDQDIVSLFNQMAYDRRVQDFASPELEAAYKNFKTLAQKRKWMLNADLPEVEARFAELKKKFSLQAFQDGPEQYAPERVFQLFKDRYAKEFADTQSTLLKNPKFLAAARRAQETLGDPKKSVTDLEHEFAISTYTKEDIQSYRTQLERRIEQTKGMRKAVLEDLKQMTDKQIKRVDYEKAGWERISTYRDGIREDYLVPRDVGAPIKALDSRQTKVIMNWLNNTPLAKAFLVVPASIVRTTATILNPFFLLKNAPRDLQQAIVTTAGKVDGELIAQEYARALAETISGRIKKSASYREAERLGSFIGTIHHMDQPIEKVLNEVVADSSILSRTARSLNPLHIIREAGQATEEMTRITVFRAAVKSGMVPEEAASLARNATVDFGKSGNVGQVLNQVIPFFNARVQGLYNLTKVLKDDPLQATRRLFYSAAAPAGILYAHNVQYDSYRSIPDYEKQLYWIVMIGEHKAQDANGNPTTIPHYLKIPKGETQIAASAAIERVLDIGMGVDPGKTSGFLKQLAINTTPATPTDFLPTAYQKYIELKTNYDFFRDKQIVPDYVYIAGKRYNSNEVDPRYRYTYSTSEMAKALGNVLNKSPAQIDHLIQLGILSDIVALGDIPGKQKTESGSQFEDLAKLPGLKHFIGTNFYGKVLKETEAAKQERIDKNREEILKALAQ